MRLLIILSFFTASKSAKLGGLLDDDNRQIIASEFSDIKIPFRIPLEGEDPLILPTISREDFPPPPGKIFSTLSLKPVLDLPYKPPFPVTPAPSFTVPYGSSNYPDYDHENHDNDHGLYDDSNSLTESPTRDSSQACQEDQLRHVNGTCVQPEVIQNILIYTEPEQDRKEAILPEGLPLPKVEHNIIIIHTSNSENEEPIVIPPPQSKHIIYFLNEEATNQERKVIEVPTLQHEIPEVYFVNYAEGETPVIPNGIDY